MAIYVDSPSSDGYLLYDGYVTRHRECLRAIISGRFGAAWSSEAEAPTEFRAATPSEPSARPLMFLARCLRLTLVGLTAAA